MKYIMALMIDKYLAWLLVRGRGVTTFFLAPTPHEKPNKILIQMRVMFYFSVGVGVNNYIYPLPLPRTQMRLSFG